MAAASAGQKVALPQQGVAVQINDGQGAMQRAGLFADLRQRAALDLVHAAFDDAGCKQEKGRSEEHTSELQSLMRISYAVFCLKKKKNRTTKELYTVQT